MKKSELNRWGMMRVMKMSTSPSGMKMEYEILTYQTGKLAVKLYHSL